MFGFKCFLLDSGVDGVPAAGRRPSSRRRWRESRGFGGADDRARRGRRRRSSDAPRRDGAGYAGFLRSRPRAAEDTAIGQVIEPARRTGAPGPRRCTCRAPTRCPLIRAARARRAPDSRVETCPHYLTFDAEEIPDGATAVQVLPADPGGRPTGRAVGRASPPATSTASSPTTRRAPPELKRLDAGDFGVAWGGIASLQLGLPAVWTEARERGLALADVVRWMATAPADRVGPAPTRAGSRSARDADLVRVRPRRGRSSSTSRGCTTRTRSRRTPAGACAGVVRADLAARRHRSTPTTSPRGRLLRRGRAMSQPTTPRRAACRRRPQLTTDRALFTEAYAVLPARDDDATSSPAACRSGTETRLWVHRPAAVRVRRDLLASTSSRSRPAAAATAPRPTPAPRACSS